MDRTGRGGAERGASRAVRRAVAYAWASPNTGLGLLVAALTVITGGEVERRDGTLEVRRAFARSLLESPRLRAGAVTLGHVILARDRASSERHRDHELGHVAQYEMLGPLFLPAYALAALAAAARGGHYYRDNLFERDADRRAAAAAAQRAAGATTVSAQGAAGATTGSAQP